MSNLGNNALGALVGPAVRQHSNRMICNAARGTKLTIAGGGGISKWEHAVETIMYGATLIQMCTKLLWDGPDYVAQMNQGMLAFMEEQGYETIADMRGLSLPYIVTPDKLDVYESHPQIDRERCTGCGICTKIGSCDALRVEDKKAVVNEEKCVSCGLCETLCPRKAISFSDAR